MDNKGGKVNTIMGVTFFGNSRVALLKEIQGKVGSALRSTPLLVFTPNPEILMAGMSDGDLKSALLKADYNIPDGIGVVLASRLLSLAGKSGTISERITGTDLLLDLVAIAAEKGWRVYFLGGRAGVAEAAAANLKSSYPGLMIRTNPGPARVESAGNEVGLALAKDIAGFKTDLLFVGFGHGKQERWLTRYASQAKVKLGMGVGGAFDFYSGQVTRSPQLMQRLGLEWLWRLVQEPERWPRIITATIRFPLAVLKDLIA
jgi:N-acetylglucosaminyldiphosphoundecaprenol N-acetyl-beta-D-mannosaminyltransferase